jgi:hypothetical protein
MLPIGGTWNSCGGTGLGRGNLAVMRIMGCFMRKVRCAVITVGATGFGGVYRSWGGALVFDSSSRSFFCVYTMKTFSSILALAAAVQAHVSQISRILKLDPLHFLPLSKPRS